MLDYLSSWHPNRTLIDLGIMEKKEPDKRVTIHIARERHNQLNKIKSIRRVKTITELIDYWIARDFADLEINNPVCPFLIDSMTPGITVLSLSGLPIIELSDKELDFFTSMVVTAIAEQCHWEMRIPIAKHNYEASFRPYGRGYKLWLKEPVSERTGMVEWHYRSFTKTLATELRDELVRLNNKARDRRHNKPKAD